MDLVYVLFRPAREDAVDAIVIPNRARGCDDDDERDEVQDLFRQKKTELPRERCQ